MWYFSVIDDNRWAQAVWDFGSRGSTVRVAGLESWLHCFDKLSDLGQAFYLPPECMHQI